MRAVLVRGVAGSALLTAGGYCYVRVARDTWFDRVSVVWSVRAGAHHVGWGLGLSVAGLVLLTWAWWDLWRQARGDPRGVRRVRRTALAWASPLLLAPPLFSGDGWSYVATGALTGRGLSPYLWTPAALPAPLRSGVAPVWRFTPSPYGPLPLAWGGLFSHVSRDPWALLAWYRLAALGSLAVLAWAVPRLAARTGADPVDAVALAVASPFVLAHGIGGLHNDVTVAALVAAGLVVTRSGRWLPGALLVGAAAAVKAPGLAGALGVVLLSLAPGASWLARIRRSALVGAVAGGTVLATGWATGLGTGWTAALSVPDREHTALSVTAVLGRITRVTWERAGPDGVRLAHAIHPESAAKQAGLLVLALVALWAILRTPTDGGRKALGGAGYVLLATIVLSPVVHYWYFLWCLPVLACARLGRPEQRALVAAVVALGLTAPADRAVVAPWAWEGAAWSLFLVPALVWAWAAVREPARAADRGPGPRLRRRPRV